MVPIALVGLVSTFFLGSALAQGCPESYGVQTYPHEEYCDKFYLCVNGTFTEETCQNGLVFDGHGHVHNHCNYNWAVDCGKRLYDDTPISSPGCLYQYGIYPVGEGCQKTFFKCAEGVAYETPCQRGTVYNNEYHSCGYPDETPGCEDLSESVVGFKCPDAHELPPNAVARRFLPYPRFPLPDDKSAYIVCVYNKPRIQNCGYDSYFDEQTLSCVYADNLDAGHF
eukprot:maker-scaffold911_size81771-snap-gene-0.26 protein:Tk03753 transcript:maker-scaffold911_size81771-snap-gene-0.26-mRNA-1 annotation:"GK25194"